MLIEVWEMCEKYLKDNKYDGLFNDTLECACKIDDLAPCGEMRDDCTAGHLLPCDCGDHDYHIGIQGKVEEDYENKTCIR